MYAVVGKGAYFEGRLSPLIVPTETGPGATFETRMEVEYGRETVSEAGGCTSGAMCCVMIELIENLMHRDEGVIGWTWRVAVARDSWRRTVGVPDRTIAYMYLQLSSIE